MARRLIWVAVSVFCGATFVAYLQPEFAFAVANRVWACF
jgi:hypothetical protein